MIAYLLLAAATTAALLLTWAFVAKHHADKVIDEILAAELRQIERERKARNLDANLSARWSG